jgi:phosphoribosyl-ATP pyrophosphohydrolase
MMVEEDKDESPDETDEEAQDTCLASGDDLDSEVDDFTIEKADCVFMTMLILTILSMLRAQCLDA